MISQTPEVREHTSGFARHLFEGITMEFRSIPEDLYRFNSWANQRIIGLCDGLTDGQLDESREMGFGSLRNTIFHILAAEEIWFERWNGDPWRMFQADAEGLSLDQISSRLEEVARKRQVLLDREHSTGWHRICTYKDGKGNAYHHPLNQLMIHVANHGIHHRAQALSYLKKFGCRVPAGLDYIFYRLARPNVLQEEAAVAAFRQFGLEIATETSPALAWDADLIRDYFAYGDWANERAMDLATALDDAVLDRAWDMGVGSIRKTLLHILDAERWWLKNWTVGAAPYESVLSDSMRISEIRQRWQDIIPERNRFLEALDPRSALRLVGAYVGGQAIQLPLAETAVQLCGHGTHHRAQLINMLRRSGVTLPGFDYIVWVRESPQFAK